MAADEANPVQVALDNYNRMEDALATAERQVAEYKEMNMGLVQENQMLRENYGLMRTDFKRVQAYATNLTTRLSVVQECVANALSESLKYGMKPTEAADEPTSEDVADEARAKAVVDGIRKIPGNDHRLPNVALS